MTRELEIRREGLKEQCERREHELPDELAYALQAAQYVTAHNRGLVEAYADGQLRLQLYLLTIDDKVDGELGEHTAVVHAFDGSIGLKDFPAGADELPDEFRVQCVQGEHTVFVAIREFLQVQQRVLSAGLGTHVIRLKSVDRSDRAFVDALESPVFAGLRELLRCTADGKLMLGRGRLPRGVYEFSDDVFQRAPKVVDDVAGDRGEFQRWLTEHVKAHPSACGVVGIALESQRRVRRGASVRCGIQVGQRCTLKPVHVVISVS